MVDRLSNSGSGLARAAIEAALRRKDDVVARMAEKAGAAGAPTEAAKPGFQVEMAKSLQELNSQISSVDSLPERLVKGEIQDIHEVAMQLKQADLSLRFAFQVRNKLIDAYREVMRMSV